MAGSRTSSHVRLSNVPASSDRLDSTDARLLLALSTDPRATVLSLAQTLGLARNTVQTRLARLEAGGVLDPFERRGGAPGPRHPPRGPPPPAGGAGPPGRRRHPPGPLPPGAGGHRAFRG